MSEAKGSFTIQILAMRIPVKDDFFSSNLLITRLVGSDKIYRYITGIYEDYIQAQKELAVLIKAGFNDAFIAQRSNYDFKDVENQSSKTYYTVQLIALKKASEHDLFKGIENINFSREKDGLYRYSTGLYNKREDAEKQLVRMKDMGFSDAFIRQVDTKFNAVR